MNEHHFPLVHVTWKDITGFEQSWISLEEVKEVHLVTVHTVGWVILDNDDFLTMVSSLFADETEAGSVTSIPKGCVVCIESIKDSKL